MLKDATFTAWCQCYNAHVPVESKPCRVPVHKIIDVLAVSQTTPACQAMCTRTLSGSAHLTHIQPAKNACKEYQAKRPLSTKQLLTRWTAFPLKLKHLVGAVAELLQNTAQLALRLVLGLVAADCVHHWRWACTQEKEL